MPSFLWLTCRSALVARAKYRPSRRLGPLARWEAAETFRSLPVHYMRSRPPMGMRAIAAPAAATFRIPDVPPVRRPAKGAV